MSAKRKQVLAREISHDQGLPERKHYAKKKSTKKKSHVKKSSRMEMAHKKARKIAKEEGVSYRHALTMAMKSS